MAIPDAATDTASSRARPAARLYQPVGLDALVNHRAATTPGDLDQGAFNVWRNSLPVEHLPEPGGLFDVDGVPFVMATRSDAGDNVQCTGQMLAVAPGRYDWIHLLASAERRTEEDVALHFDDGQVDFEAVRVSDFWAAPAAFDEPEAVRTPTMHYPHHVQQHLSAVIWAPRVPVTRRVPLVALRLPRTLSLHLFAVTLEGPAEAEDR